MEFAHDRRPRFSVEQQAAAIQRQRGAVGTSCLAHFETFSYRWLWAGNNDGMTVRNGNRRSKNGKAHCQPKFPQVESSHNKNTVHKLYEKGQIRRGCKWL